MALVAIQGGWYDAESHGYYGPDGKWVPSATQVLSLCGLSDYSMVNPEVLAAKRAIGNETHDLCATIDKYGTIDPDWISESAKPYVEAYQLFREQRRFVPAADKVEVPIIACIAGMLVGVTPDAPGKLDGYDAILERKCVAAPMSSWAVQTAIQEMALFKTMHCGRTQRFALQLKKTGKYRIDAHDNHKLDAQRAISALVIVYARIDSGEKVWESL
jgi:hypothetical protein